MISRFLYKTVLGVGFAAALSGGCADDSADAEPPEVEVSPEEWKIQRAFPTTNAPGVEFAGCIYSSPMEFSGPNGLEIVALGAEGNLLGLDPTTGEQKWSLALPAAQGQGVLSIAQPAFIDDTRIVVAYHTVPGDLEKVDANSQRLSHRVAVIDLVAHAVDPDFETIELEATHQSVEEVDISFRPSHALARGDVKIGKLPGDSLGKVYITAGNTRDIQPWHGWAFEIDLDAWQAQGAELATSASLISTPEPDENCGPENSSGSRERKCGGGFWAPSGPLIIDQPDGYELVLAAGNGQLDLARKDYANTLMRTGAGLEFDPACDASLCADFNPDEPSLACIESCENLWIPRLSGQDDKAPEPWDDRCDGLTLFECWQKLDYIGGSTPSYVEVGGYKTLSYPTKDGHLYLIDQTHYGTQFDRIKLVDQCGAADDPCAKDWAGMAVTQPLVAGDAENPILLVPTFMPDKTHPAGIVAVAIKVDASGPRYERLWEFPDFEDPSAIQRFREHPSRMMLTQLGEDSPETAWVVEVAKGDKSGKLIGLNVDDGARVFETALKGPGRRYAVPLRVDDMIYVSSCDADSGPGRVEGFKLTKEATEPAAQD
ncbi:hypothetical protein [Bradymonas sediminis]|nr:hypothetical protein [Bradymonas sediminis]TDP75857.1 hypothetical protein DFR33_103204 [Bradymonas sediminis]